MNSRSRSAISASRPIRHERVLSKFNYRTACPRARRDAHEFHNPVSFPAFTSIVGERLLPTWFGGEIRPQKANANRFPLKSIVGRKTFQRHL